MRRLIATTAAAAAVLFAVPAMAQVSPEAHEKCLKAEDYKGCIEILGAVIKNQINPSTQNIKLNIDTQVVADGNQCPAEFAYAGAGYCRRILCVYGGLFGIGHHPDLAGKGVACHKGRGEMRWGEWDKEKVRASVNPTCPNIPLEVGYQSTCSMINIKGAMLLKDGQYESALKLFKPLSDLSTADWFAASGTTTSFFNMGNYSDALAYARRANDSVSSGVYKYLTEINLAIVLEAIAPGSSEAKLLANNALKKQPRLRDHRYQKEIGITSAELVVLNRLLK
jgi:tetratricopeptide (TPR) repeat protein